MMTTGAQVFTTIHLVILAILALIVIAGIVWGSRLRQRSRIDTEHREEQPAAVEPAERVEAPAPRAVVATPAPEPRLEPEQASLPRQTQSQFQATPIVPQSEPAPPAIAPGEAVAPVETTAVASPADQPVTVLKGLGPKLATRLGELGIATVGDIAALSPGDAEALDAQLGPFTGRMTRDRWIEQAKLLAAGDRAGFEAAFGKL